MKKIGNLLLAVGLFLIAYAVFSRFYGQPGIALKMFKSNSVVTAGYICLILSLVAFVKGCCQKN